MGKFPCPTSTSAGTPVVKLTTYTASSVVSQSVLCMRRRRSSRSSAATRGSAPASDVKRTVMGAVVPHPSISSNCARAV